MGSGRIQLALKYVSYRSSDGVPVISEDAVRKVAGRINDIYRQCDVEFIVERYQAVDPAGLSLPYGLSSMSELPSTRQAFEDVARLVVINTGNWNHGTLGPANAWTTMPGSTPSGAVLEALVAESGEIVAHELGHYLNLDHVSDTSELMNPVIYSTSTRLTTGECAAVRESALTVRAGALRG